MKSAGLTVLQDEVQGASAVVMPPPLATLGCSNRVELHPGISECLVFIIT